MAVTTDSFTEGRLTERLGQAPARLPDGAYDLSGANLSRLSLTKAQLAKADLRGATLRGADLMRACLAGANLQGADLADAKLQQADLCGADLRCANLTRAVLNGTAVTAAKLAAATLHGTVFRGVALWETDLVPDDLTGVTSCDLCDALALLEPPDEHLTAALAWCSALGGLDEKLLLRRRLKERRWRGHLARLKAALQAIEQRIGPLSGASISRARPGTVNERSISQADRPEDRPGPRSLSRLKQVTDELRRERDGDASA